MPKSLFTVRGRKRSRHPQVIVKANKTKFSSMSLTHTKNDGHYSGIEIKNPQTDLPIKERQKNPSYVQKRIIEDFKFNFSKVYANYKLDEDDIDEIIKFLKSKKKEMH